jgi:hypothetical protein
MRADTVMKVACRRIGVDVNGNALDAFTVDGRIAGIVVSTGESCELLAGWGAVFSGLEPRWNSLRDAKAAVTAALLDEHARSRISADARSRSNGLDGSR